MVSDGQPDFLPQTPPPHFVFTTNFSPVAIIGATASPKPRRHRVPDPVCSPGPTFSRVIKGRSNTVYSYSGTQALEHRESRSLIL